MGTEKSTTGTENGKRNGKLLLIACIAVIAILLAVILALLLKKEEPQVAIETEAAKRNVVVNAQNVEEVAAEMASVEYVEPGYYTVNMATEWHFPKWDEISKDARVDNVAGNTNPVYFDVFIQGEEEEPIYRSPVIPVGSFLENITLERPLDAGTYDCVVVYHLVDDDQETISTLRVTLQVIVEA